jgi:beta-glucosidase
MAQSAHPRGARASDWSGPDAAEPTPADLVFPVGFMWGAATSAYQVEGGITANNWADWERRSASAVRCGAAAGHWERFDSDLDLMRWLGISAYRFSIEWSRIEPLPGYFDPQPMRRYRSWCERLRAAAITPLVTLHHFSEPLWITERGGFADMRTVSAFGRYVEHVATSLHDLVQFWTTINEPVAYAVQGWWRGVWPPGRTDPATAVAVLEHLLLAHGAGYRALHATTQDRSCHVGLAHNFVTMRPHRHYSPADRLAARCLDATYNRAALDALTDGELRVRLPGFSHTSVLPEIAGTQDYLGVNHYHPLTVRWQSAGPQHIAVDFPDGTRNDLGWTMDPTSLADSLRRLAQYGLPLVVLEHGACDSDIDDRRRRRFLAHSLAHLLRAVMSGLDVRGYIHWSLLDGYEWGTGHTPFGLFRVDPITLARSPTSTAHYYRRMMSAQPAPGDPGPLRP